MKINQYCSVCKQHLDMEVIPTSDAGDDGVIWLRCPQCMGFLPKFSGERAKPAAGAEPADPADAAGGGVEPAAGRPRRGRGGGSGSGHAAGDDRTAGFGKDPGDSPARAAGLEEVDEEDGEEDGDDGAGTAGRPPREPIAEYAAMLAAADVALARPYRPTDLYAVGDVVHHLAYGDVGVVVAKETLPGGRQAVKVFFEQTGIVRLIEQATGGH